MSRHINFAGFQFNVPTRELLRVENGGVLTPISLGSRAADVLLLFLNRPGELIAKNEIIDAVWPDLAVEESNLTVQISALRRVLDSGRNGASCIQTVAGRGYRFTVPVTERAGSEMCLPAGEAGALQANAASPSAQGLGATPEFIAATSSSPQSAMAAVHATVGDKRARHWRFAAAAMVAVFCSAVVVIHWRSLSSDGSGLRAEPRRLSIVALPFTNASGEPKDDDLAAALTEDFTTSLTEMPGAFVVARSMAQATDSRKLSLPAVGGDLGVRYVLEGTIRRSSGAVELKVQLSEAANGVNIWAAQFQGAAGEPRDQIIRNLLFPLRTAFMDAEAQRLSTLPLADLTVEDLLLKVRAANNHPPITAARGAENIELLERALAFAPNSSELLMSLAREHLRPIVEFGDRIGNRDDLWFRGRSYVERARAVAAGSEAMFGMQAYLLRAEGRFDEAILAYTALMRAAPDSVRYHLDLAQSLIAVGRSAEAVPLLEEAIRRSDVAVPRFVPYGALGQALIRLGRNDEAIDWLLAAREQSSGRIPQIYLLLAAAHANVGRTEDARRELRDYVRLRPTSTLRGVRHTVKPTPAAAEEQREFDGLARSGLRDHVDEDVDAGLPITMGVQPNPLDAPTPRGAPGVSVIRTFELATLIDHRQGGGNEQPLLLSTMCTFCLDIAFPGSIHVPPYLRDEPMIDEQRGALKAWLAPLLDGNPRRRLIIISWNAERWHGRNLALELVALGYPNVSWYRGGLEAWDAAGLPVQRLHW
jgi:DNA-binding winged helix-turn-helix (wHTH) protein/TolB-like protein/Flp pilus assembly protein TadD